MGTDDMITRQSIPFPGRPEAIAVLPAAAAKAEDILRALALPPFQAVVLLIGSADNLDDKFIPPLTKLFGRGIASAASEINAVILDGGTQAGVIRLMGEAAAAYNSRSSLIGVVPLSKVSYPGPDHPKEGVPLEPNHSHFVLVQGNEWGSETSTLFQLVSALTGQTPAAPGPGSSAQQSVTEKTADKVPGVVILVAGGKITRNEMLQAVRHKLTVIIVQGSGGLADEIAAAWQNKTTPPEDPALAEIIEDGHLQFHLLTDPVKGIERLIVRELGDDKVLIQAWETFADYDLNANIQQKRSDVLQLSVIILGVIGTALAISKQFIIGNEDTQFLGPLITNILIVIPILLTILITASTRFKQGNKWLLLRAAAESIKREIFRYRVSAMNDQAAAQQQLAQKVEDITRRTMTTEVNTTSLKPYDKLKGFPPDMYAAKGGDDGFSNLTPERYVQVRLGDQLNYFKKKSVKLEKQLKALSWCIFLIGGVGTYLTAVDQQVWIALTTALASAVGAYLGYRQTENTLTKYNQAFTNLANVKAWWNALSADEQSKPINIGSLVDHTEQVLQTEMDGWVQQMQNALAELRKNTGPADKNNGANAREKNS
jgi:hypothetical protein